MMLMIVQDLKYKNIIIRVRIFCADTFKKKGNALHLTNSLLELTEERDRPLHYE